MIDLDKPIIGRWNLIEELGRGKHGVVYKARSVDGRQLAAVKIISLPNEEMMEYAASEYGNDSAMIDNFVGMVAENFGNEVESMAQLYNTPYVIKLYDNRIEQTVWTDRNGVRQRGYDIIMVLEYAQPMKKYFSSNSLRVMDVIDFACDIAKGISECEKRNIIHRDIKEDNLFIGFDNYAKLGDFGVASINDTGLGTTIGMGTPYYEAPEVTNPRAFGMTQYDNRADIYSLGIVLYRMLNENRFPFADGTVKSQKIGLDRRMRGDAVPYPKNAKNNLGNIILKCCKYYPSERFSCGEELYRTLLSVKREMSKAELEAVLPYLSRTDTQPEEVYDRGYEIGSQEEYVPPVKDDGDLNNKTRDILEKLTGTVAVVFRGLVNAVSSRERDVIEEEYKRIRRIKAIILSAIAVAVLGVIMVMLFPKTATFYTDPFDNDRIHVKYLFFPDYRKADVAASYLAVEGNWLYYSNPEEDHSMYRMSVWGSKPELLCSDDCEYNIMIGDYIYFTSFDEGEILCRIKKDGTKDKEVVLNFACRDLKRNGNNLIFILPGTNEVKELDTSTIN